MKKKVIICVSVVCIAILVVGILFATHVLCIHKWNDATCIQPKKCTICNRIKGKPLGHTAGEWTIITEPTCSKLGKSQTKCTRCGEQMTKELEKTPHTEGKWTVKKQYVLNPDGTVTPGIEVLTCKVCGEIIKEREYIIEISLSQKNAVIKAYTLLNSIHPSYEFLIYDLLVSLEGYSYEDAKFAVSNMDVDWDEQAVLFAKENINGESKGGLVDNMRFYKFNDEQISKALKAVGY
ncbi:MAG: hypothetical protein DBY14_03840 [Escherichia coli]|nr:MAG: hypothetical protein DBY14_03840 [Escherichia coli]